MRVQIFFLFVFLIDISIYSSAQADTKSGAATVSTLNALRTAEIKFSPPLIFQTAGYYKAGDKGGGLFYWSANSMEPDDSALVIKPSAISAIKPGRYIRIIEGASLNILWFGGKPDGYFMTASSENSFDNLPIINHILSVIEKSQGKYNEIYLPMSQSVSYNGGYGYFFSGEIDIKTPVKIKGDAGNSTPATILIFNNTAGIKFFAPNTPLDKGRGTIQADAENLWLISSNVKTAQPDGTNYGMYADTKVDWRNIRAEYFQGDGFFIHGGTQGKSAWYTVADNWFLMGCIAKHNAGCGLNVLGEDANVGTCINFIANDNKYWGIRDESKLGNVYISPQLNNNGVYGGAGNDTRALVKVIGATTDYYLARQDNQGHQPVYQQSDKYWSYTGTKGSTTQVWNSTSFYPSAGAMTTIGNANKCAIYGMYTEFGQTHTVLNGVTINMGGYQGTSVVQGMYATASGGDLLLNNGIQANSISFGNGTSVYQDANGTYSSWDFTHPLYFRSSRDIYLGGSNPYTLHLFNNKAVFGSHSSDNAEKWQFYGGNVSISGGGLLLEDINHPSVYKRILFASEAPSSGTFSRGDLAYNSLPEKNGVMAWRCIKAGSPGLWEPVSLSINTSTSSEATESFSYVSTPNYVIKNTDTNVLIEYSNGTKVSLPASPSSGKAIYLSNQSPKPSVLSVPVFKKNGISTNLVQPDSWVKIIWDGNTNKWWLIASGTN